MRNVMMLSLLIAGGVGCGNSNASIDAAPTGDSSADAPIVGPAIVVNQGVWTPNRDGNGEVLPTDFSQLPLQQWVTVGGSRNKLRDVEPLPPYPSGYGPSGFANITGAWGGAAWDHEHLRMLISGGGHGDASAAETEIIAVDAVRMETKLVVDRQPLNSALKLNGTMLEPGEGFPGGYNNPLSTGVPGSNHTYEGIVWLPPSEMQALGLAAPNRGGMFYGGGAKAVVNLDDGKYTKLHWNRNYFDISYLTTVRWKHTIIMPRSSFYAARFDLLGTEMTDWQTSGYDLTPTVPSFGANLPTMSMNREFVGGGRVFCDLPERGEMVSFAAASARIRYGAAQDANAATWDAYVDAITLTGPGAADFTADNLKDAGTNLLSQGGAHYVHATGEIYVCPNPKDAELYRITGVDTTTWTVTKLAGTGLLTTSGNGTYGRFVVFQRNGSTIGMRISSVDNPIEVIRLK